LNYQNAVNGFLNCCGKMMSVAWPKSLKRRFYGDRDRIRMILIQLPLS